jgi:hypothetical protein
MRTARKLMQSVALALAGLALAAGPAYATTIAEVGNAVATEQGSSNFDNGNISITCTSSDATLTFANSGATTIDTLTFAGCSHVLTGMACTYIVTNLPQTAQTTFVAPDDGELTPTGPTYWGVTVDCGALTCTLQSDDRLTGMVTTNGGTRPRLNVVNQPIVFGGDAGCSTGIDGNANLAWTINSTANGTDTTLTITA